MKKLLILLTFLPLFAAAQPAINCDNYITDRELSDGTHRFESRREMVMLMDGAISQRMGLYLEMGNYQHSFRLHLRALQGGSYMGGARNMTFIFGDGSRIDYPLTVKRDNGEWIAEFAGRAPETELVTALRTRYLRAIELVTPNGAAETRVVSIPERYVESLMRGVDCISGMVK